MNLANYKDICPYNFNTTEVRTYVLNLVFCNVFKKYNFYLKKRKNSNVAYSQSTTDSAKAKKEH